MNRSICHARGRTLTAFLAVLMIAAGLLSVSMTTAQAAGSGTISGKVTKVGGVGLPNISVTLYEAVDTDGKMSWEATDGVATEADGTYTLAGLPAGTYRLGFDDPEAGAYAGEFYDNAQYVVDAADIDLEDGAAATGKNAELAIASHILGKVTKPGGTGIGGIDVTTYERIVYDSETYWVEFSSTVTADNGTYDLGGLPGREYRVGFDDFERENYLPEYFDNKTEIEDSTTVYARAGTTVTGKNAELVPAAHITGKVTKSGGTGLEDIEVTAYEFVNHGGGDTGWEPLNSVATNGDGTYSIGGLPAGTYRIGFDDFENGAYAGEYFNNKKSVESAEDVKVNVGATASGKNGELAAATHITGTVTNEAGSGIENIDVSAYQRVDGPDGVDWQPVGAVALTANNGTYDLGGLAAGTYRIGFDDYENEAYASEYFDDKVSIEDAEDIVVAAASAAGKNAELAPAGHITGKVTGTLDVGLADIDVVAYTLAADGSWQEYGLAYTGPDGAYSVGGLPGGTYRIGFEDVEEGDYAPEFYDKKRSIDEAEDIVVATGATVADRSAKLVGGASLDGTVTKAGGGGLAHIEVVAYAQVGDGGTWEPVGFGLTRTNGEYNVDGLVPGVYRLGFHDVEDKIYATEYYNDKSSVDDAKDFTVQGAIFSTGIDAELALDLPDVANTVAPTVTGTAQIGKTLTAKPGTWTPTGVTFKYQWRADGTTISGATATTYKPVAVDVGKKITVAVTGAKSGYTSTSKTSAETAKVSAVLATPKNHRSTAQTSSSLTLAWDAVPDAPKYRVQFSKSSTMSSPTYLPFDTNGGVVTGLAAKTKYYFKVSVVDENNSARLTPYTATAASASTKPYEFVTPSGLKSTAKSSTSLTLAWTAVAGAPSYRVQVSKSSTMSSPTYVAFDSNSGTVSGLTPNTKYYFKVSVTNADHSIRMSSYTSTPAYATTKLYDFTPPANITSTDQTSTSLSLAWDAPDGAPGYRIQISKNSDMSSAFYRAFENNDGVITGLAPSTLYYFRVAVAKADNTARLSDYSAKPAPSARTKVATP